MQRFWTGCVGAMAAVLPFAAVAQEVAQFGAWKAYCAPVAGCVMGVKSEAGDTLAFIEPPSGDAQVLLFLVEVVPLDAKLDLSIDGTEFALLAPETGWRAVETAAGQAVEIDSVIVSDGLIDEMRRRTRLTISYPRSGKNDRRVRFSLNGFADTRSYVDED